MRKLLLGLIILGAAGYGLLSYHFILFDSSLEILQKTSPAYENTFVDARGAKKLEILLKPDLIAAGINDVVNDISTTAE